MVLAPRMLEAAGMPSLLPDAAAVAAIAHTANKIKAAIVTKAHTVCHWIERSRLP